MSSGRVLRFGDSLALGNGLAERDDGGNEPHGHEENRRAGVKRGLPVVAHGIEMQKLEADQRPQETPEAARGGKQTQDAALRVRVAAPRSEAIHRRSYKAV